MAEYKVLLCLGGHAGAYGAGVVIDILLDKISMNKARAFNPFLCAATDKLKALIAEVQSKRCLTSQSSTK